MVRHIEPRMFSWSKGRRSEPSWLGSWVDSPEQHCENKIDFFATPSFCRFFSSFSPSILSFLSRSLSLLRRTTHATPLHPIAHASCPYPSLHFLPTRASCAHSKTLFFSACIVFLFFPSGTPLTCLAPTEDLLPPFDEGLVPL